MKTNLEPTDIELMEQAAAILRDKLLVRLLFRLGCRVSEALAIRVSDVDFARRSITILHLKRRMKLSCSKCKASLGKRHQFCPQCATEATEARQRWQEHKRIMVLPIDEHTLAMLGEYINSHCANSSLPIFGINRHRAWQIVRDCATSAGIPVLMNPETGRIRGVSPHRLRDAFSVHAMKLDDSGDALRLLQEHLGHASFNTTAKYRKIAGEEHREWYDRLWKGTGSRG